MSARHEVVVTGMGCVTPLGGDASTTWQGLRAGRSGVRPIERFDASGFNTRFAGQIDSVPALEGAWETARARWDQADLLDRKTWLALVAAREAWEQAGGVHGGAGAIDAPAHRIGLSIGSEGGRRLLGAMAQRAIDSRDVPLESLLASLPPGEWARLRASHPTRVLASELDIRGPTRTVCTACTSSGGALAEALYLVRAGVVDVALAGGTDTLVEAFMVSGFSLLGALSENNEAPAEASRPFDLTRDGFVLGEGAGMLVLESEAHARARGATILGRLRGAGLSNNAFRITDSPPDGEGPAIAMRAALRDAGVAAEDVGYVNAHGTSTQMNDVSETRGIRRALGPHADRIAVSSNKSMIGHLVAACGAVEAITTLHSLRDSVLAPTLNLRTPDPECDLDYVPGVAREVSGGVGLALSNAFGFGGSNATLVLEAP
ncbi:MAG: beta-ketoacyl-[acyl-carrier-protein] synthase family protein [Deltaproteobacteria bacterium]|nr:beta-ketoacyl-[acyl-carrier-protein] synthase family protein [Deltaproteobacteria bacterium]